MDVAYSRYCRGCNSVSYL